MRNTYYNTITIYLLIYSLSKELLSIVYNAKKGVSQWLSAKESACNVGAIGDSGLILGLGRFPGVGHSNPLQYSFPESPKDRGALQAIVHRVAQCQT